MAACSMFSIFGRSYAWKRIISPLPCWEFASRWLSIGPKPRNKNSLEGRIFGIRILSQSAIDVLEGWVGEGNYTHVSQLKFIANALVKSNRHKSAYEIYQWMVWHHGFQLGDADYAQHVRLTNNAMGIAAAECYFEGLPTTAKTSLTYAAIICCYVSLKLTEKVEEFYKRAWDSCLRLNKRVYLEMMCLYMSDGQVEKVPLLIRDMKCRGVKMDLLIYNSWISSCAATRNINEIKRILDETSCVCEEAWVRYMNLVKVYISTDQLVNSEPSSLVDVEESIGWKISDDFLIILYAGLANIAYVNEIWKSQQMLSKKMIGRNFVSIVSSYAMLGKMKEVGEVIDQWKRSSGTDMSICKRLLNSFHIVGLAEQGDAFKRLLINQGYDPAEI